MSRILIVDDDELLNQTLSRVVKRLGHESVSAFSLAEGIHTARTGDFDVVFLDVRMPDGNGVESLPSFRDLPSNPEVIIVTAYGEPDGARLAIENGAWDYIKKPGSIDGFTLPLLRALQYRAEKQTARYPVVLKRDAIIGNSPRLNEALERLAQASASNSNVLIIGETGTGKELFARSIHQNSCRAAGNFVVVDCAALPENLVEGILFGHEKGAYTGADRAKEGLIRQADGGTLFLDEVGELPLHVQKAFLRVLQERKFRPLGAKREVESDFRLVAATHRNLDDMVKGGSFREDLLFRLRSFAIELPPLRERKEDIRELTLSQTARLCDLLGLEMKGFSSDFLEVLSAYDWPGNVRELFNALEESVATAHFEPTLFPAHLPTRIRVKAAQAPLKEQQASSFRDRSVAAVDRAPREEFPKLRDFREDLERGYLRDLVDHCRGNKMEACRVSGLSRARLYDLLKKYDIQD